MYCRFLYTLLVFLVMISTGCKSLDINGEESTTKQDKSPWWKKDDLPPVKPANKIVAIWSNSVFNESGAVPIRGLGGRIYFYDSNHKPVRVDGKMTVFLYDDTLKTTDEKQEATRKIHFTAEEVAEKYTPTEFGPSYSFWVPWDAVGGERIQLSVIPVFTSHEGEMLVGEQAKYLLPGRKPAVIAEEKKQQGVIPVSFIDGSDEGISQQKLRLTSSTIKVPPTVQRRLRTPSSKSSSNPSANTNGRVQIPTTRNIRVKAQDSPITAFGRARESRSGFDQNGRQFRNSNRETSKTSNPSTSSPAITDAGPSTATQPSTGYQLDPRQVQDLQSLQQAAAHDPNVLDRAKQLFAR